MELLHVYSASDGTELFSRDLSGEKRPFIIALRPDGTIEFSVTASAGNRVIGALVRNEDGWSLASASLSTPVVCGPKSAPDMQLMAGMACAIGGFTFRLEKDETESGCVIIWRYDGSKPVMDSVIAGRNLVALTPGEQRRPAVNPPLVEEQLFEFFPSVEGLDVVSGNGESRLRLQVPVGTVFACGAFEGMYLSAKDGAAAMKCANPFSWPSRRPRRQLMLGLFGMLAVFAVAVLLQLRLFVLDARLAEPRGAVRLECADTMFEPLNDELDENMLVMLTFVRALPAILQAQTSSVSLDLIRVAQEERFANEPQIQRMLKFLLDVRSIQECIATLRWEQLEKTLKGVDRDFFTTADADDFLGDAEEVCGYANKAVPEYYLEVSEYGSALARTNDWVAACRRYDTFTNKNTFTTCASFKRELSLNIERWDTLVTYVKARNAVLSTNRVNGVLIDRVGDAFAVLKECYAGTAYEPIVHRERKLLSDFCDRLTLDINREHAAVTNGFALARLENVAVLGDIIGVDSAKTLQWREAAKQCRKDQESAYRRLYQTYRLKLSKDPEAARKLLDEMVSLGGSDNTFHVWALREIQRFDTARKEKKQ